MLVDIIVFSWNRFGPCGDVWKHRNLIDGPQSQNPTVHFLDAAAVKLVEVTKSRTSGSHTREAGLQNLGLGFPYNTNGAHFDSTGLRIVGGANHQSNPGRCRVNFEWIVVLNIAS